MDREEVIDEPVVRVNNILYVIEYGEENRMVSKWLTVNVYDVADVADDCYP